MLSPDSMEKIYRRKCPKGQFERRGKHFATIRWPQRRQGGAPRQSGSEPQGPAIELRSELISALHYLVLSWSRLH